MKNDKRKTCDPPNITEAFLDNIRIGNAVYDGEEPRAKKIKKGNSNSEERAKLERKTNLSELRSI